MPFIPGDKLVTVVPWSTSQGLLQRGLVPGDQPHRAAEPSSLTPWFSLVLVVAYTAELQEQPITEFSCDGLGRLTTTPTLGRSTQWPGLCPTPLQGPCGADRSRGPAGRHPGLWDPTHRCSCRVDAIQGLPLTETTWESRDIT